VQRSGKESLLWRWFDANPGIPIAKLIHKLGRLD
jgi:hypothetical protein